jgi:hypothetical protein
VPTSTPVQFEPDALRNSIQRLLDVKPQCMYLTHYGRVVDVPRLGQEQLAMLDAVVQLGHAKRHAEGRHQALKDGLLSLYLACLQQHGCTLPAERVVQLLAVDLELSAQGMAAWLDRDSRAR